MVREFKKTGVAAALTGALMAAASFSSQATVQLSAPGDVMLVPYVVCDVAQNARRTKNTLVGLITFWKERLGLGNGSVAAPYLPAPAGLALVNPSSPTLPSVTRTSSRTLHWYFYNSRSEHIIDGIIPVTDNDFVRFDWCTTITTLNALDKLNGVEGYLIFVDNVVDRSLTSGLPVPTFALYGHSYQIVGNWASQAFIPVLANPVYTNLIDPATGVAPTYNIEKRASYPAFRRLVSGTDFTDTVVDGVTLQRDVYMRYFLDESLATENKMVFWFNTNEDVVRASVPGEVYDSEQNYLASFSVPLKNELNIITSTPDSPAFPGMAPHEEAETYGAKFVVKNTGILRFGIPEVQSVLPFRSSGVSFNMVGLGAGGNDAQLQTEMATEGEDYFLF